MTVSVRFDNSVAIVTIDNPPVNAVSQSVRQGLIDAVATIDAKSGIDRVILRCAGRTFVAGADVREFNAAPLEPHLPDVISSIETAKTPWVAALHGTVLGGGLELAMACHARVAHPQTKLGLPEVTLGLIPGAGGTVRLPRLVAPKLALNMVAGGKPIGAAQAQKEGLIDALADDPVSAAEHASLGAPTLSRDIPEFDRDELEAVKSKLLSKARGQLSISAAIDAVGRALTEPAETALAAERESFLELKTSDQARALRHIFFAERQGLNDPRCKGPSRDLNQIGVIGGGTMGAGICAACLLAGFNVQMIERDDAAAKAGADRVTKILDQSLARGILNEDSHRDTLARFNSSDSYDSLGDTDLVIEAVFEELNVKKEVFAKLDAHTKPEAILASNTSYLDVNAIAESVDNPSRVIGLHFFSPAHIMKLLEIVLPDAVADDVVATAARLSKKLGKIGVLAGVCDGFIANRIMSAYRHEADLLLIDGASPWDVDAAMRDFGFGIGVFQMQDLAGLDIAWAMRKRRAEQTPPGPDYVSIADKLCENGWFGQKAGRGWYIYENGRGQPSDDTMALILAEREKFGKSPDPMSAEVIMSRILGRMRREAEAVLNEGIAMRREDIDVVMVNGYGFPRTRGGPLFEAG